MIRMFLNTVRSALLWMVFAAILDGISGLLLVPVIINWGSGDIHALVWLLVSSLASLTVVFIATQKGYLAGGIVMRSLTSALIRHLPVSLKPIPSATSLVSGPVSHAMSIPAHLLHPIISGIVTPLTVILGAWILNFWLGGILLMIGFMLFIVLRFSAKQVSFSEKQVSVSQQNVIDKLDHFATHQPLFRRAGISQQQQQSLELSLAQQYQTQKELQRRSLPFHLLFSFAIQVSFIGLFALCLLAVNHGTLTLSMWLAAMLLLARFIEPLWLLSHLDQALRQAKKSLNQIAQALETPELHFVRSSPIPTDNSVSCHALSQRTAEGKTRLKPLDLTLKANTFTAIVGASGAGKSTLLHLLARLQDPSQGEVRYGNQNIALLSQEALCRKRGILFQDNRLFKGSLRQNLAVHSDEIDDTSMIAMLQQLNIDADHALLDADVGAGGQRFSGGQRQRLCIARLLLSRPDIILMDEPTASLDYINTASVIEQLLRAKQQTRIVVTHQPMLASQADHIVVMASGEIIDQGTHAELFAREPWYQQFIGGHL
ncbi:MULTISPECIES: ATP-binding cassette domain-containing protein [Providencia]|uniref:ABC transporter ATP-binding protein n=1 Tax=Providencia stuartii TaxID=588 RepID=A0ABD5LCL0_PROST|nr:MULTISPECIES: ABC transporter ATP-binding protein [Providencia]ELR5043107.1 ABC transporter ATP-binding protein [Providencia rettgeri]ELR5292929.1 ABC transporter ATP-binding protein [Providencia stuartii]MCR4182161.1 ABC transporter ATP-binding protein/permease [Providencia vermicola]URE78869.1 ABC transporter ATP-binding protein/permease [Providencia stuartii]